MAGAAHLPSYRQDEPAFTSELGDLVDEIYTAVISAGTYHGSSVRLAKANKILASIRRDVNIALVNESTILFNEWAL